MKKIIKVRAVKLEKKDVIINTPFIKLDSLLKFTGIADTGGFAKTLIKSGEIAVNGEVCLNRGRKIKDGDKVRYKKTVYAVKTKEERD